MSLLSGQYTGARTCTGSATPGAKALMAWYLGAYQSQGAANLGIYLCKSIAGTSTTSLHGEGRAGDLGSTPYRNLPFMDDLADALVAHSAELGIQCVIHDGHIWSSLYPHQGWRVYHGLDPHRGHLHTELTVAASRSLTVATIERVLGRGGSGGGAPVPRPTKPGTATTAVDWTEKMIMALPTLKAGAGLKGARDENVQTMQNLLQARGYRSHIDAEGGADGKWGPATTTDLKAFQKSCGIKDDGVCGKVTWHWLLRQQNLL